MQHDICNHLNSIISVSDMLLTEEKGLDTHLTNIISKSAH